MGITNFPVAHINSTSYWDSTLGVSTPIDVDVAVLDSGIDLGQPDLTVVDAQDFTGTGWNGQDCSGHGTAVAGVIGAINNTFGVAGLLQVYGFGMCKYFVVVPGQRHSRG